MTEVPGQVEGVADGRTATLEGHLSRVLKLLTDLADAQRSESIQRREADDALQSEMRTALLEGLDEVRAQVAAPAPGDPTSSDALEARVDGSFATVLELIEDQRRELGALATELARTRAEMAQLAQSNRELAAAQEDADRRVVETATRMSAQPAPASIGEAFRIEIAEAESRIAEALEVNRAELQVALDEGLAHARLEVASLEAQLRSSVAAVTDLVETQRSELGTEVSDRMRQEMTSVARTVQNLTDAHDHLQGKLDSLLESAFDAEARVNALASSVHAGARGLHALERSTGEAVDRLTGLIEGERRMRERTLAGTGPVGRDGPPQGAPSAPVGAGGGSSLLDALDGQLREAEARLARRSSTSDAR